MMRLLYSYLLLLLWPLGLYADEFYSVSTVAVPRDLVLEVTGLAYADDGSLYLCTRYGDVWQVQGDSWKRFAYGLHEPMGLCLGEEGQVFVSQRPEITELLDTDRDGVADQYNTLCDSFSSIPNFHQYTYGLVMDKEGNFYGALSCTGKNDAEGNPTSSDGFSSEPYRMWSFKVTPDGNFIPFSSGLRSANGIGKNTVGDLFSADNQGDWVGTSMLHHLSEGDFHGHVEALRWDTRFKYADDPAAAPVEELNAMRKMPAVHFPHGELMNSPGAPVCDNTKGKFGPFAGQFFIGDVVHANIIRVALEKVKGQYQGACFPFITGGKLKAGICRLAFSPKGELIVGRVGEGDWARGKAGQGLQKVRFNGTTPLEVHSIELKQNGFMLHFTKAVDDTICQNAENYHVVNYHYQYHAKYGSPKMDVQEAAVSSVKISSDKKQVFLEMEKLIPRKIYDFKLSNMVDENGEALRNNRAYYTLNELSDKE